MEVRGGGARRTVINHARLTRPTPRHEEKAVDLPYENVEKHMKHVVYIMASSSTSCIGSAKC